MIDEGVMFWRIFELPDAVGELVENVGGVVVPVHRHGQGIADKRGFQGAYHALRKQFGVGHGHVSR